MKILKYFLILLLGNFAMAATGANTEKIDVTFTEDGFTYHIREVSTIAYGKPIWVEIGKIDETVLEQARENGGVLTFPDEVVYEHVCYEVDMLRNILTVDNSKDIKEVILPKNLKTMFNCINGCEDLEILNLPEGFKDLYMSIGMLPKLRALGLPESLLEVGELSLNELPLSEMDLKNVEVIDDYCCNLWMNVKEIKLPKTLRYVGNGSLNYGDWLEALWLPENENCGFAQSSIPPSKRIYALSAVPYAFHVGPESIWAGQGVFDEKSPHYVGKGETVLYVPEGSERAYREHEVWGKFKEIRAFDPAGVEVAEGNVRRYRAVVNGGVLTVENPDGESVRVYGLNGALLMDCCDTPEMSVTLPEGMWLLQVGDETEKIVN